ncbi:hypothetical protein FRC17_004137 [Serendipita sp. 399]|nr:hypothetical protein FRC17_004137 [Serendipita sp. 399]
MDYLHALPTELWREILLTTRAEYDWGPLGRAFGSFVHDSIWIGDAERARHQGQAKFLGLLRTCKTLYPLVEEAAWSSICLAIHSTLDQLFIDAALGIGASGQPRGRSTKTVHVTFKCSQDGHLDTYNLVNPWLLHTICPNLHEYNLIDYNSILIATSGGNLFQRDKQAANWASKVTSLYLNIGRISPDHIRFLAKWFPSLCALTLWSLCGDPSRWQAVTFPVLRRFYIHQAMTKARHILSAMHTPQLEVLHMDISGEESGILRCISAIKQTLISLSAPYYSFRPPHPDLVPLPFIFYSLPKLQTLEVTFQPDTENVGDIHPELLIVKGTVFPLEELEVYVSHALISRSPRKPKELSRFLRYYFPKDWYPHIRRLVLKGGGFSARRDTISCLKDAAQDAIPQAEVDWVGRIVD